MEKASIGKKLKQRDVHEVYFFHVALIESWSAILNQLKARQITFENSRTFSIVYIFSRDMFIFF